MILFSCIYMHGAIVLLSQCESEGINASCLTALRIEVPITPQVDPFHLPYKKVRPERVTCGPGLFAAIKDFVNASSVVGLLSTPPPVRDSLVWVKAPDK